MVANIKSGGVDVDTLFAAHVTNNAANLVGYRVAGGDIQTRFDPLSAPDQINAGSRIPTVNLTTSATGYAVNTDFSTIFCGNASQYSLTTPAGATGSRIGFVSPITLTHTITVSFSSAAALTNYFYYGGRILLSATHTAGTAADNTLATMFSNMGTLVIYDAGHYKTGAGGTISNATAGGSNTGNSLIILYNSTDGAPYTSTSYVVRMIANAAPGSATVLTITATLTINTSGTIADTYTGTYTSNVQQRNHPTQAVPTFSKTGP